MFIRALKCTMISLHNLIYVKAKRNMRKHYIFTALLCIFNSYIYNYTFYTFYKYLSFGYENENQTLNIFAACLDNPECGTIECQSLYA